MWRFRFSETRQDHGPDRRRGEKSRRRSLPALESLEGRELLNGGGPSLPAPAPAIISLTQVQCATKADVDPHLTEIYKLYRQCHADIASLKARFPELQFQGNAVLIGVKGQGDFQQLLGSLRGLGMNVTAAYPPSPAEPILDGPMSFVYHRPDPSGGAGTQIPTSSASDGTVHGYLPIDQIPAVAALPQVLSVSGIILVDAPDVIPPDPATPPATTPPLPPAPPPIVIPELPIVIPPPPAFPPGRIPTVPLARPAPVQSPLHLNPLGIAIGNGGQTQVDPSSGLTRSSSVITLGTPSTVPAPPPHKPFPHRALSGRIGHQHASGGLHHLGQIHISLERTGGPQTVPAKPPAGPGL